MAAWQCVHVHVRTYARGCTVQTLGMDGGEVAQHTVRQRLEMRHTMPAAHASSCREDACGWEEKLVNANVRICAVCLFWMVVRVPGNVWVVPNGTRALERDEELPLCSVSPSANPRSHDGRLGRHRGGYQQAGGN